MSNILTIKNIRVISPIYCSTTQEKMSLTKSVPLFVSLETIIAMMQKEDVRIGEEISDQALFVFECTRGEFFADKSEIIAKKLQQDQYEEFIDIIDDAHDNMRVSFKTTMADETPHQYGTRIAYLLVRADILSTAHSLIEKFKKVNTKSEIVHFMQQNVSGIDYSYAKLSA